jgi:hypothetical protein
MKNLIGLSVLAAMMLIPCYAQTAQAGASVSVSVGFGTGYATCYDDDMDWDNVIVIDNSTVGFWVMLPSGHWVLRCRSMWWNQDCDDWCFGPWYYNYSIAYGCHCHDHFAYYCPFHAIRFHAFMNMHYRPWHDRYFHRDHNRYVRRYPRHDDFHHNRPHATVIRERETVRYNNQDNARHNERTTVIVREKEPVRIDGGNRPERIETRRQPRVDNGNYNSRSDRGGDRRPTEVTRSRTMTRESGNQSTTITRTETRRHGRSR